MSGRESYYWEYDSDNVGFEQVRHVRTGRIYQGCINGGFQRVNFWTQHQITTEQREDKV
jgi:hypothetical protein